MPGPSFLLCDTDALLQLLMADCLRCLEVLKRLYGIAALVVPEVELEVTNSRKFGATFEPAFRKARGSGLLQVIDQRNFARLIGNDDKLSEQLAGVSYESTQQLGRRLNLRVDLGEAYTHAIAISLGQPALSNDFSALKVLHNADEPLPSPVLRSFDLITFAYQVGEMSEADCDRVRKALLKRKEGIPRCWKHARYAKGLREFTPRLLCSQRPPLGLPSSAQQAFLKPLVIDPLAE